MMQTVNDNTFPELYSIPLYKQILLIIGKGKEQGIHLKELCKFTGTEERAARKAIEAIRRKGVVICSTALDGYFLPETIEELKQYLRQEEHRGRSTFFTIKSARKLLQELNEVAENGTEKSFHPVS